MSDVVRTRVELEGREAIAEAERLRRVQKQFEDDAKRAARVRADAIRQTQKQAAVLKTAGAQTRELASRSTTLSGVLVRLGASSNSVAGSMLMQAGALGEMSGAVAEVAPRLGELKHGLLEAGASGSRLSGVVGSLIPTVGQLGVGIAGLAVAYAAGKGIAYLADQVNNLDGEMQHLQATFEASEVGQRKLAQLNEILAAYGMHATTVAEAQQMLKGVQGEQAAVTDSLTTAIGEQLLAMERESEVLDRAVEGLGGMNRVTSFTDAQLRTLEATLVDLKARHEEWGGKLTENEQQLLKLVKAEQAARDGAENLGKAFQTTEGGEKAIKALGGELEQFGDTLTALAGKELTASGQSDLVEHFEELRAEAEKLKSSLGDKFAGALQGTLDELDLLGGMVDELAPQMAEARQEAEMAAASASVDSWIAAEKEKVAAAKEADDKIREEAEAAHQEIADDMEEKLTTAAQASAEAVGEAVGSASDVIRKEFAEKTTTISTANDGSTSAQGSAAQQFAGALTEAGKSTKEAAAELLQQAANGQEAFRMLRSKMVAGRFQNDEFLARKQQEAGDLQSAAIELQAQGSGTEAALASRMMQLGGLGDRATDRQGARDSAQVEKLMQQLADAQAKGSGDSERIIAALDRLGVSMDGMTSAVRLGNDSVQMPRLSTGMLNSPTRRPSALNAGGQQGFGAL